MADDERLKEAMTRLLGIMASLRDPEHGCPWDRRQDFATIVPHTLEEAYEVADAIERGDYEQLRGELGDLLFQVVFYARLGEEEGRFSFTEIAEGLAEKLQRRHPHVRFPDRGAEITGVGEDEVHRNWERIKHEERTSRAGEEGHHSVLDDIPLALPALARARKLQRRAANTGFDWTDAAGVLEKVDEEIAELREVTAAGGDPDALEDELGDLLFTCVNLSRHLGVDAETALRRANRKFEARFRWLERELRKTGHDHERVDADRLEALWERAKQALAGAGESPSGENPGA